MEFEGRSRVQEQLSIAPLIDVVFLLLLFFMVTSSFHQPEAIELDLPRSTTSAPDEDRPVEVSVDAAGVVHLDGAMVDLEALKAAVVAKIAADPATVFAVRADAGAVVQRMVDVLDAVRGGGGTRIALRSAPGGANPPVAAPSTASSPGFAAPATGAAP